MKYWYINVQTLRNVVMWNLRNLLFDFVMKISINLFHYFRTAYLFYKCSGIRQEWIELGVFLVFIFCCCCCCCCFFLILSCQLREWDCMFKFCETIKSIFHVIWRKMLLTYAIKNMVIKVFRKCWPLYLRPKIFSTMKNSDN